MPSLRRMRVFGVIVFFAVIYILYLTSKARTTRNPDFYSKTKQALERGGGSYHPHALHKGIAVDDDDEALFEKLAMKAKEAEEAAKETSKAKAKPIVENIEPGKTDTTKEVSGKENRGTDESIAEKTIGKDDGAESRLVDQELNSILKRSPIIIFSKSYCPHSKRAKNILLEKYTIVPSPYVIELDQHPLGLEIQAKLADMTGRSTVPNVIINGKSIGGGDDIAELDQRMTLIDKIKSIGGKRMVKVEEKHM